MPRSAAVAIRKALEARIVAECTLLAGERFYKEGRVPTTAPMPRVVLGPVGEPAVERYQGQPGRQVVAQLRWWAATALAADLAYEQGVEVLQGYLLPMTTHKAIRVTLGRTTDYPEPTVLVNPPHVVVSELRVDAIVSV